jgi:hypothetical protein
VRSRPWSRALIASAAAVLVGGFGVASSTAGAAAASGHPIRPGAGVTIAGVHCKVGLLLHRGKRVYVGIPASCTALPLDEGKAQDGCAAASAPIGTPVHVAGATHRAILKYDSFTRMESVGTTSSHKCYYNDLALALLNPADAKLAAGTIPGMNAPKSVSHRAPAMGDSLAVGHSPATAGATTHGGWVLELNTTAPTAASDVGTPVVQGGQLVGMLTGIPQGVVMKTSPAAYNLRRALAFMRKMHKFRHVVLLRAGQTV